MAVGQIGYTYLLFSQAPVPFLRSSSHFPFCLQRRYCGLDAQNIKHKWSLRSCSLVLLF